MKMYVLVLVSICTLSFSALSQNLVNNPSFEITTTHPNKSRIPYAQGWVDVSYTNSGAGSTADMYHQDGAGASFFPYIPHLTPRYAGLASTASNNNNPNYREFIRGSLTSPLVAGQEYVIEFWARKAGDHSTPITIGAYLTTSPITFAYNNGPIYTPHASATIGPVGNWEKISGCFTPQTSGPHYIVIGNFGANIVGGQELNYFFIDDVSVEVSPGFIPPVASLSLNASEFCLGDQILASDNGSTNFQDYLWKVTDLSGSVLAQTSWLNGTTIPNLDVATLYTGLQAGECYNVELFLRNGCETTHTSQQFCIQDPTIDFIFDGNPVCANVPLPLSVTGDNSWTYTWSTGDNGVGVQSITTTPTAPGTQTYTVDVTTNVGCTFSQNITVTVHDDINIAPYVNGMNNSGNYTAYVQAGDQICFNIPSFDSSNELVVFNNQVTQNTIPSGAIWTTNNSPQQTGSFCWTPSNGDIGYHSFDIQVEDNNACGESVGIFTFNIKVVCDYCPLCIYYENRTPQGLPLPSITETGHCIIAGENVDPTQANGVVETGNAVVEFIAPEIDLEPGFTGGPNFTATIDPNTCTDDCEACCDNFTGFTIDLPLSNVFSPNGDGVGDVWFAKDNDNPFCAFNAKKFRLRIFRGDDFDLKIWDLTGGSENGPCCQFWAPSDIYNVNLPHSSIWWNGTIQSSGQLLPHDETVFYILELWGCGAYQLFTGPLAVFVDLPNMAVNNTMQEISANQLSQDEMNEIAKELMLKDDALDVQNWSSKIYPNPIDNIAYLESSNQLDKVTVYDTNGKLVRTYKGEPAFIEIGDLESGVYLVRLHSNGNIKQHSIVKQ